MKLNRVSAPGIVLLLVSCGGDSVVLPKDDTVGVKPLAPQATPSPTPQSGSTSGGPHVFAYPDRQAGPEPLIVGFDLCKSTDSKGRNASNGADLEYLTDFEGQGLTSQGGQCSPGHTYRSNGVSVFTTQLCVRDNQTKQQDCTTLPIKAYVRSQLASLSLTCDFSSGSAVAIESAQAHLTVSGGVSTVTRVDFLIFDLSTGGSPSPLVAPGAADASNTNWTISNLQVPNKKVRTQILIYSGKNAGDDFVDSGCKPPPCGGDSCP